MLSASLWKTYCCVSLIYLLDINGDSIRESVSVCLDVCTHFMCTCTRHTCARCTNNKKSRKLKFGNQAFESHYYNRQMSVEFILTKYEASRLLLYYFIRHFFSLSPHTV